MPSLTRRASIYFLLIVALGGCVEQTMSIRSDPPGAIVSMNDQELGRTPLEQDFTWYGDYQIEVRKDGYQTIKTHKWIKARWWNWVPLDLFANLVPWQVRDHKTLIFAMKPVSTTQTAAGPMMERAFEMQGQLQSSRYTRMPSTEPATKPAPAKAPTTQPAK